MNSISTAEPVSPSYQPQPLSPGRPDIDDAQLFFDDQVIQREERIAYAMSNQNVLYLRESAGSMNVWLTDEEFAVLVRLEDPTTFACFARCEQMKPHHLLYMAEVLAQNPHRHSLLANADETRITLMKALELQGGSSQLEQMRAAIRHEKAQGPILSGSLWARYGQVSTQLNGLNMTSEVK